jgi:hypothetical protein
MHRQTKLTHLYQAAMHDGTRSVARRRCERAHAQKRLQHQIERTAIMNINHLLVAAALTLIGAVASAQTAASAPGANTPRIDQRQANQERRIDQGVASGALTKRETRRLEKQQAHIDKAEDRAKADGTVTAAERKRPTKMQNHASRDIYRQKHDQRTAGGWGK